MKNRLLVFRYIRRFSVDKGFLAIHAECILTCKVVYFYFQANYRKVAINYLYRQVYFSICSGFLNANVETIIDLYA